MAKFLRTCDDLIDTFPELHIDCAAGVAALVGDLLGVPGPRLVNTLLVAAADGNAGLCRYIIETYRPDVTATFGPDGLGLLDVLGMVCCKALPFCCASTVCI
eukprot:SAG22_NODE_713_length_7726_cov_10.328701_6_plen_102_part_00